jgi:hypothetical protein
MQTSLVYFSEWSETKRFIFSSLLNFALKQAIRKVQENQEGLIVNAPRFLAYADNINLLGEIINTTHENTHVYYPLVQKKMQITSCMCTVNTQQKTNWNEGIAFIQITKYKFFGKLLN